MKFKKLFSAFIAGTLAAAAFSGVMSNIVPETWESIQVSADEVCTDTSGTCGDNLTWKLDDEGTLTISGSGRMYRHPFARREDIKQVVIHDGVTSIGADAFYECKSLTSVTVPDSVSSIGGWAFFDTPYLRQHRTKTA